ncbi:MAG TPA: DUF308 domain-containing protein [Steroidobacteraceae bacterium]|nr:DUF308 domain-containing protein [Steroidobacteraceae bacterium]
MPTEIEATVERGAAHLARTVREHSGLYLTEGIILVLLGILALIAPLAAALTAAVLFGWILLASGIVGLVMTLRARQGPGFTWSLLSAIVGIAAGLLLLLRPLAGAISLTVVLIGFLLAEGIVSIFLALDHRKSLSGRWGWLLVSGIVDLVLAVLLLVGLPGSSLWVLGLLIAINLIYGGIALIAIALHARRAASAVVH